MKNKETLKLLNSIRSPEAAELDLTFSASVLFERNERNLVSYVTELQNIEKKFTKVPEVIKKMQGEQLEELKPYVKCDDKGEPIIAPDGSVRPLEDEEAVKNFAEITQRYNDEYKEDIDKYNSKVMEWRNFFNNEEADVKIEMVPVEDIDFPKGRKFNRSKLSGLFLMIDIDPKDETSEEEETKEGKSEDKE